MSGKQTENGKAFEYAVIIAADKQLATVGISTLIEKANLDQCHKCYRALPQDKRNELDGAAQIGISHIFFLEQDKIDRFVGGSAKLRLLSDKDGIDGDVRDIVLVFVLGLKEWEFGISAKHHHNATKHQRISPHIDIANQLFGGKATPTYQRGMSPIFNQLRLYKEAGEFWRDVPNKGDEIYKPLLRCVQKELLKQEEQCSDLAPKLTAYFVGNMDYYKLILLSDGDVKIEGFNIRGALSIDRLELPTKLMSVNIQHGSDCHLIITLDNQWSFDCRIHSASSKVECSLKFDTQIFTMPEALYCTVITNKQGDHK